MDLGQVLPGARTRYFRIKIMEFDLKWVHMARYELILKLDGALWLRIILKSLLTQKWLMKIQKLPQKGGSGIGGGRVPNVCLGPLRHLYIY